MPNVPVHAHLLPDGNVLFWGRRDRPDGTMDEHECTPQIWDRAHPVGATSPPAFRPTPQPASLSGEKYNLFCSGHTFLPDGRLLVVGGHIRDSVGVEHASLFDWRSGNWTALPAMNHGRWYPTATILPDGGILAMSGSYADGNNIPNNSVAQIWDGHGWRSLHEKIVSLYPRLIVIPDGRVFVAGTDPDGAMLTTNGAGNWSAAPGRAGRDRQYAPALAYGAGKIMFIGGGNDQGNNQPTANVEKIDFNAGAAAWTAAAPMTFRRRQHNATLLPDGTVLVTGGTRGGGFDGGFNDLSPGAVVHEAELWDPAADRWTVLAPETNERCYHSIALLLPDATVLSAGGGEYKPNNQDIAPEHVHRDGQVFQPPYLFRGERPSITAGPEAVGYDLKFEITVAGSSVARLTALRLGSVTHSLDANQRLLELGFAANGSTLTVSSPAHRNDCPPGWYMLFALSATGVPSHAHMIRFGDAAVTPPQQPEAISLEAAAPAPLRPPPQGTRVVIGLTSRCPYGLAACWGGAYQSLQKLAGVVFVNPVADATTSTAELFLHGNAVPDVDQWKREFHDSANASYEIRGIEISIEGQLSRDGDRSYLTLPDGGRIELEPAAANSKVQWNWDTKARESLTAQEQTASERLAPHSEAGNRARVTGPLSKQDGRSVIAVRRFELIGEAK
jgi:hypothetical protein